MRRIGFLTTAMIVALCCLGLVASEAATGDGFEGIVRQVEGRYHVHGKRVPMMWGVSLLARGFTHGGVRGLRVVEYEGLRARIDGSWLDQTVRSELGSGWSPMVRERSDGETSLVYVQSAPEKRVRMVVVSSDGAELNLVRVELSPEALAKWEDRGKTGSGE